MRDRDREDVEDDERADQERDQGKDEEELSEKAQALVDVAGLSRCVGGAGLHQHVRRHRCLNPAREVGRGHTGIGGDEDGRDLSLAVVPVLSVLQRDGRQGGAPDGVRIPELEDPGDRHGLLADPGRQANMLPDFDLLPVGEALVDRDVTVFGGERPRNDRVAVEAIARGGEHQRRGPGGRPNVFAVDDECPEPTDLSFGEGYAGYLLDRRDERLRERSRLLLLGVERGLLRQDDVGALIGLFEDVIERAADLVGQDERAGDHRGAKEDRDAGQYRAELSGAKRLECEPKHSLLQ